MNTTDTIITIAFLILILIGIFLIVRGIIKIIKAIRLRITEIARKRSLLKRLKESLIHIDNRVSFAHSSFCDVYYTLRKRCKTWIITSIEPNDNWRSSAKNSIERVAINLSSGNYRGLSFSTRIPKIHINRHETYYFYPSFMVINLGGSITTYDLKDIDLKYSDYRLIVDPSDVTKDSKIVDYTYRYVNYDGSPDGRFSNNDKCPIVLYGNITIHPLGEEILVSNADLAKAMCDSFVNLKKILAEVDIEKRINAFQELTFPPIIMSE